VVVKLELVLQRQYMSIADEASVFDSGGSFETDSVDYNVRQKIFSSTCSILLVKSVFDIKNFATPFFFLKIKYPSLTLYFS